MPVYLSLDSCFHYVCSRHSALSIGEVSAVKVIASRLGIERCWRWIALEMVHIGACPQCGGDYNKLTSGGDRGDAWERWGHKVAERVLAFGCKRSPMRWAVVDPAEDWRMIRDVRAKLERWAGSQVGPGLGSSALVCPIKCSKRLSWILIERS